MKKLKKMKGFTLIEVLIVIAIIGILATVMLIGVGSLRDRAKISNYKSQVASLQPNLVADCDAKTLDAPTITADYLTPLAGKNLIGITTVVGGSARCGSAGDGAFSVTVHAVSTLGTSTAAGICETGATVITPSGITFPDGC